MTKSHNFKSGRAWQITGFLAAALFTTMTVISPANAGASAASSTSAVKVHTNYRQAIAAGSAVHGCPYSYFCAYSGEGYTGQKIEMYYCQYYGMPFGGNGSFVNNQTPGTVAKGYDQNYKYIWNSGRAFSADPVMEWTQIWYVKPC